MSDTPRTDGQVRRMIDNDISPEGLEHFARDLERELAAAAIELRTLRTANERLLKKVQDMEAARTLAAANSLANMLAYEDATKKIAALIKEGDELAKIVRRDYRGAFCEDWEKAKGQQ